MRFSRERSCSVEIPGSTRCSSTNRRGPETRSRTISSVHLSPTRSSARASGDHWSYGCRFGRGRRVCLGLLPGRACASGPRRKPTSSSGRSEGNFLTQLAQVPGTTSVCENVGTVISLADRRRARARTGARNRRATFYFDLADPADVSCGRAGRAPAGARRLAAGDPARAPARWPPATATPPRARAGAADRVAGAPPEPLPRALRVAAHAARQGRGAEFVLAATRLAFCGGFDLEDPAVFAEAVAAAGLDLDAALWAAGAPGAGRRDARGRAVPGRARRNDAARRAGGAYGVRAARRDWPRRPPRFAARD